MAQPNTRFARRADPAAPGQPTGLAPRVETWPRDVVVLASISVCALVWGVGIGGPAWVVPVGVLVGAACAGRTVFGRRAAQRHALVDRLVEALAVPLGVRRLSRSTVRATRWVGWPGAPWKVALHYSPAVDDSDPAWPGEVAQVASRRLGQTYRVARHQQRRCRLLLELVGESEVDEQTPAAQVRAERVVGELLGQTARVKTIEWGGEELAVLDVAHEAGPKVASAAYRTRVERVVSTMFPGRWRARWDLVGDTVRFEVRPQLPKRLDHPDLDLSPGSWSSRSASCC